MSCLLSLISDKLEETVKPDKLCLFEFDKRFSIFKEFIYYDFENPEGLDCKHTAPSISLPCEQS